MNRGVDLRRALAYLAAALLLFLPAALRGPDQLQMSGLGPATLVADGEAREVDLRALTLPKGRGVLAVDVLVSDRAAGSPRPLGLYLSGTFSAEAWWNGTRLGAKGRPGGDAPSERAGPIDVVLPLPREAVRPGANRLTLVMSAQHLNFEPRTLIHGRDGLFGLRVAPYSAEARRPLGYYAIPFLMSGVLLIALAVRALRARPEDWLAGSLILAGLALAALAEISRSLINYPYPWHALRLIALTSGFLLAGGAMVAYAMRLAGLGRGWRMRLAAAAIVLIAAVSAPIVADGRILIAGALAGCAAAVVAARRGRPGGLELAGALGLVAAYGLADTARFADQGLYAAIAPLIAHLVWPPAAAPAPAAAAASLTRLAVGRPGDQRVVPVEEISAIHGAGNYVEVRLRSGARLLHDQSLDGLAAQLPSGFLRVHRSHIVSLAFVRALRSLGGGRHRVQLADGEWLPVARTRVAELRRALEVASRPAAA